MFEYNILVYLLLIKIIAFTWAQPTLDKRGCGQEDYEEEGIICDYDSLSEENWQLPISESHEEPISESHGEASTEHELQIIDPDYWNWDEPWYFSESFEDLTWYEALSEETSSETTTTPQPLPPAQDCPPDKSMFSAKDIDDQIESEFEVQSIFDSVKNGLQPLVVDVHDKHLQYLNQFLEWINDRPEHLKQVLDGIAEQRNSIEEAAMNIATELTKYPQLSQSYYDKMIRYDMLMTKVNQVREKCRSCHINDETDFLRQARNKLNFEAHDRICISNKDLKEQIKTEINKTTRFLINTAAIQLKNLDLTFYNNTETIKNNFKDAALKLFGRAMYDILSLEDQYIEYNYYIKNTNMKSLTFEIQQNIAKTEVNLLQTEINVNSWNEYCSKCGHKNIAHLNKKRFVGNADFIQKRVLDKIKEKFASFNSDMYQLLQEVAQTLEGLESVDNYLVNLKPLQEEIESITKDEMEQLQELMTLTPRTSIGDMRNLLQKFKNLQSLIEDINEDMAEF